MSRSSILNIISMNQSMAFREELAEDSWQRSQSRERVKIMGINLVEIIGTDAFRVWWTSAPDDDYDFELALKTKLTSVTNDSLQ